MVAIVGFLVFALPHVPGIYLSSFHLILIPSQIIWLYASYFIACKADPGTITEKNVNTYIDIFPYDGLLYTKKDCWTCNIPKPARSKHCPMCKSCIARLDHHCAWLNKCVGYNNHRYFFLFLFTLTQFCAYGFYLCFQIYRGMIIEWGLDKAYLYDRVSGEKKPLDFRTAIIHILHRDRIIGSIGILTIVVSVVVFIFTAYQLYLAGRGITTNEAFKWEVLEDAIYRGEIWIVDEDNDDEGDNNNKKENKLGAATANKSKDNKKRKGDREHQQNKTEHQEQFIRKRTSAKININSNNTASKKKERQIQSLEEVDNIYDKGFFANLYEVFFPKSISY
ncbi:DHHC palmitoyltransferase-domain-containing protein [Cunninghamella echinulata]|nr:DHHC palmitoyltransferase-domain-containing protein [Cunninghamella echinulata]